MNILTKFKGQYIKSGDLNGKPQTLTIESVEEEDVGEDRKPVLRFKGSKQGLVLNKTNAETIAEAYGSETADWVGRAVELFPDKTKYAGKTVDCVRVRIPEDDVAF